MNTINILSRKDVDEMIDEKLNKVFISLNDRITELLIRIEDSENMRFSK